MIHIVTDTTAGLPREVALEKAHETRYKKLLANIETGQVFRRSEVYPHLRHLVALMALRA